MCVCVETPLDTKPPLFRLLFEVKLPTPADKENSYPPPPSPCFFFFIICIAQTTKQEGEPVLAHVHTAMHAHTFSSISTANYAFT